MKYLKGTVVALALLLCPFIASAKDVLPDDPIICLAANIYHESRGEPILGQYYVAFVTMNRVKSEHYPDTICGVVTDRKQFSWYGRVKKIFPEDPLNDKAWKQSIMIAKQFVLDPDSVAKDPTEGSLWYHAVYVDPYWNDNLILVASVGKHLFYKK